MSSTTPIGKISLIDWYLDDGVNLPMINDVIRNRFYDKLLSNAVVGKKCIDIGFGTGLLSMISIKYGASHVLAFESDADRYQLGCSIINELKLQDRIELVHQKVNHRILDEHPDRLVFTEIVDSKIFGEGLFRIIPRSDRHGFIPGRYFIHLHCIPISWNLANGLFQSIDDPVPFDPGIDIDPKFIDVVNKFYKENYPLSVNTLIDKYLESAIYQLPQKIQTVWGHCIDLNIAKTEFSAYAGFEIDAERCTLSKWAGGHKTVSCIDFDQPILELNIDLKESADGPVIIVPRAGIAHDSNHMMLDTGHWGPASFSVLCVGNGMVKFRQDLQSGDISYHDLRGDQ